jgi:predicted nucleic acid-binding protein
VNVPQRLAIDTSLAVPLLSQGLGLHAAASDWARGKTLFLSGHAAPETYSVLTRLPGELLVSAQDAVRLIDQSFAGVLALPEDIAGQVHQVLAALGIAGGAVYDGLVALAAKHHGAVLATRDARARGTYEAVGVAVQLVGL